MGCFSGPRIADPSDLASSIDLANPKNYSGSGTLITDAATGLSSELSNRDVYYKVYDLEVADYVLPNSGPPPLPTFSTSNGGEVTFDGASNCLRFNTPTLGTTITVEIWAKFGTNYADNILFGFDTYKISTLAGGLGFSTTNNDIIGISQSTLATLGVIDTWNQYVFEMRTDVSYTNNKIYINGVLQTLTANGTESAANRKFNTYGSVASWVTSVGYETPMTLSTFRLYNRSLTATEVLANYNAIRSRFAG
jgi:hypothetical protein